MVAMTPSRCRSSRLPVTPGLVEIPREVGLGRELDDVLVARRALGQQGQVVVELLAPLALAAAVIDATPSGRPLEPALTGHVGLDAQHRDDAGLPRRSVEVEDAVHVAVVGDSDGGLAIGDRGGDDVVDPGRPVEHRVLGVDMEMGETVSHPRLPFGVAFPHAVDNAGLLWTSYRDVILTPSDDSPAIIRSAPGSAAHSLLTDRRPQRAGKRACIVPAAMVMPTRTGPPGPGPNLCADFVQGRLPGHTRRS